MDYFFLGAELIVPYRNHNIHHHHNHLQPPSIEVDHNHKNTSTDISFDKILVPLLLWKMLLYILNMVHFEPRHPRKYQDHLLILGMGKCPDHNHHKSEPKWHKFHRIYRNIFLAVQCYLQDKLWNKDCKLWLSLWWMVQLLMSLLLCNIVLHNSVLC